MNDQHLQELGRAVRDINTRVEALRAAVPRKYRDAVVMVALQRVVDRYPHVARVVEIVEADEEEVVDV